MKKIEHLINGKLNSNFVNNTSSVFNPATGEEASQVVLGTEKCVQDAVNSAKKCIHILVIRNTTYEIKKNV